MIVKAPLRRIVTMFISYISGSEVPIETKTRDSPVLAAAFILSALCLLVASDEQVDRAPTPPVTVTDPDIGLGALPAPSLRIS